MEALNESGILPDALQMIDSTVDFHPICAAAGVANLKLIDEMNLVQNAAC